jgi:shikimate kinase
VTSSNATGSVASTVLPRRILLVGMMGAGKTTVGRLLADRLHRRYVDSDEEVEAATGHTVRELFEEGGERMFRPLESQALASAVAADDPVVVGVAGGAVLDPANRALMRRSGTVVWLRAKPETLARRVAVSHQQEHGGGHPFGQRAGRPDDDAADRDVADRADHRPLLEHDPEGVLRRLSSERRSFYEDAADVVVDVDDVDPAGVVERVLDAIGAGTTR